MAQLLPPVPEKFAEKEHTRVVQMNSRRMGIEAVTHDYATRFVTEMGEGYGVTEPGVVWRDPLLNERPKAWSFLISINIFAATFLKPNFDPQVIKKVLAQDFLFAGVRIIDPSLRHSVCKTSCRQHLFALRKELDKNVDELAYHYWNFTICASAPTYGARKKLTPSSSDVALCRQTFEGFLVAPTPRAPFQFWSGLDAQKKSPGLFIMEKGLFAQETQLVGPDQDLMRVFNHIELVSRDGHHRIFEFNRGFEATEVVTIGKTDALLVASNRPVSSKQQGRHSN